VENSNTELGMILWRPAFISSMVLCYWFTLYAE